MNIVIISLTILIALIIIPLLTVGTSYLFCSRNQYEFRARISQLELSLSMMQSRVDSEKNLNARLNNRLNVLERETTLNNAVISTLKAENSELRQLVSHGGRVIREAMGNKGSKSTIASFISSDRVKGFLLLIEKHGIQ